MITQDNYEKNVEYMDECIERIDLIKERSKKTIEDCDNLIAIINEAITEIKSRLNCEG